MKIRRLNKHNSIVISMHILYQLNLKILINNRDMNYKLL